MAEIEVPSPLKFGQKVASILKVVIHPSRADEFYCPDISCTFKADSEEVYTEHYQTMHKRKRKDLWG